MSRAPHSPEPPPDPDAGRIRFSFRFLETTHPRFEIGQCGTAYFRLLLRRLADLSGLYVNEFVSGRSHALRIHRIDFDDGRVTERTFGVPGQKEVDGKGWQFSLSANEHGRVHGFLIENVFFVRWLDPEHNLYARN
jgi:hypothetical protein